MEGFAVFVIAILILAVMLVVLSVKPVSQCMEYTVERFGCYTKSLSA